MLRKMGHITLPDFMGWRCSACSRLIRSVEDGWVEWLASEDEDDECIVGGLRLVHRGADRKQSCRYNPRIEFRNNRSIVEGLPLERLTGPDGLMMLLSFLASGDFPKGEIIEFAKRVHVPGYELTCNLLDKKIISRVRRPFLGQDYYLQSEMQQMISGKLFEEPAVEETA